MTSDQGQPTGGCLAVKGFRGTSHEDKVRGDFLKSTPPSTCGCPDRNTDGTTHMT